MAVLKPAQHQAKSPGLRKYSLLEEEGRVSTFLGISAKQPSGRTGFMLGCDVKDDTCAHPLKVPPLPPRPRALCCPDLSTLAELPKAELMCSSGPATGLVTCTENWRVEFGQHLPEVLWATMPLPAEEWRDPGPEMGSLRECLGAGCPHLYEKNNKCLRDTFHAIVLSCCWPYK